MDPTPGEDDGGSTGGTTDGGVTGGTPSEVWLELPAEDNGKLYPNAVELKVSASGERNYTAYYDTSTYTSMWTASPSANPVLS